ncbi:protein ERGIC-53-like isoform X3 [Alexandromys fortis]|uniref:protein ERGIC-53-like isoform X3 n=1 Tax=Alexandromys fortis TaxID=100897 RepID=UPI00215358D1|nr:protein ERGIC-53-like isoform X3 [Microtus fortis]
MLGTGGPSPSLCLLFPLLALYSAERSHPPQRRFEYKLSFKGPRLAVPGTGIPFWSHHGDAIPGLEEVRLAPSMKNRSGAVWSKISVSFPDWEVEMQMRVTGPGCWGALGMAMWYIQDKGQVGSVPEGLVSWDGIKIFFDSSANDIQNSPAIRVLTSDGHGLQEQFGDGTAHELGSCQRNFRNWPYPIRARITYWRQRLQVSLSGGLTPNNPEELCVNVESLFLGPGGFFGVSAATSTLADDHDVLSFLTFSLREPGPEVAPQTFMAKEQFRLARKLEELQARLALGTSKDSIRPLGSEVQEEGERFFDLEDILGRQSQILQALQALSRQLDQAERKWKQQLGSTVQIRPEGGWNTAKVSTLLYGQRTLLQALQEMRKAAARMASGAQVFYLPVGTKHHFFELDQILSLLQKDLRDLVKRTAKAPRPSGWLPGTSACLRTSIFLFFLVIQTVGFFCYMNFSRQELDKRLQEYLSTGSLPLEPMLPIPRTLGALRRQPVPSSMHA